MSALVFLLAVWLPAQYQVPVLMYHSVAENSKEPLNNVRPERFDAQMRYIKSAGYKVLRLEQFVADLKAGKSPDHKSVVITFDDGYKDNYTAAYPLLKKYSLPATIFVEVERIGRADRFNWEEAVEMSSGGIDIQSHLMTGAYVPELPYNDRIIQMVDSKRILEAKLKKPVLFLAYPIGGFDEAAKKLAQELGYQAAFTTNRGFDRKVKDLYEIKRIRVKDSDLDRQLWLKLSGYYNLFRSTKNPF